VNKTARLLLVFVSFFVCFAAISAPERPLTDPKSVTSEMKAGAVPVPIDDLFYTRAMFGGTWSADGKEVVFTSNFTGRFNLWKVHATGGWPIQLSQSDDRQGGSAWSPDGRWIVYQQDKGGNELWDLYVIPSNGGEAINLTDTPKISESSAVFSPGGRQIAFEYKPQTASATDIALLDWSTRKVRNLTLEETKDHGWSSYVWSRDGETLFADRGNSGDTDSDIYRIDVASGKTTNLTPHKGDVMYHVAAASPDGRTLLVSSNEQSGYSNVALLDAATKKLTWVTHLRWDAGPETFSPDGKTFTYTVNQDGRTDVYLADTATRQGRKLSILPGLNFFLGNPTPYAPDGTRLLVSHQGSKQPGDIWVYDLATRVAHQLTFSAIASLKPDNLPQSQVVHYQSFDGTVISAFVWVPFNLHRDGTNPAIVMPHGGPTGQTTDSFNRTAAVLATRGYICIAPNVRGSTGYGLEFQKSNHQDLGGGDLQDEVYAAKFLVATGYADAKRIGITGGSYGGYMTLMAIGKTPDVWAAAVEEYGIINWFTMLEHEDPRLQEYEKSLLGDPVKDREVYENASPIKYVRNAKAPLLVLQGENDVRVPKEEAEQVVSILKDAGKTVEVHYYAQEGHGFFKRENQVDAIRRTVEWFDKYLKGR
jgi:dipeptidyl aminopeptidase/acylaminoacyl peptidase